MLCLPNVQPMGLPTVCLHVGSSVCFSLGRTRLHVGSSACPATSPWIFCLSFTRTELIYPSDHLLVYNLFLLFVFHYLVLHLHSVASVCLRVCSSACSSTRSVFCLSLARLQLVRLFDFVFVYKFDLQLVRLRVGSFVGVLFWLASFTFCPFGFLLVSSSTCS